MHDLSTLLPVVKKKISSNKSKAGNSSMQFRKEMKSNLSCKKECGKKPCMVEKDMKSKVVVKK